MSLCFNAIWDLDMIFIKDFLIRDAFAFKSFTLITEKITRAFYGFSYPEGKSTGEH